MAVYIDVVYLFNKYINQTAKEQSIKYHVGNFPGGSKSIVLNKYNHIIDTILSISYKIDNTIEKIKDKFNDMPIKYIIPSNYILSQPHAYKGWSWNEKHKKFIPLSQFMYYLGCDIKECLIAYDKTIDLLGSKLLKAFQEIDQAKLTKGEKTKINEFKLMNNDWETLVKNTPQEVDTELTNMFLDEVERKQLRIIYYNKDILKNIYNAMLNIKPTINKHSCNNKYTIPSKIAYYTKNIKYKLSFVQSGLTTDEIQMVFNYVVSHLNIPFAFIIEDNSVVISNNEFTNTPIKTLYYTHELTQRLNKSKRLTGLSIKDGQYSITLLDVINSVNTDIPIIDVDPDRHLEIFIEYPQHVLYNENVAASLIKNYNWQSLNQGLNHDLLPEYTQNVSIIVNKFKFKHLCLH